MLGGGGTSLSQLEEASEDGFLWHGEPVYVYSGDLSKLASLIPFFRRQPFGMRDGEYLSSDERNRRLHASGENRLWDEVVRMSNLAANSILPFCS
jgi:hypothetical protein